VLAREETPRGEIQLQRRDNGEPIFEIIFNGVFLMASDNRLSASQLATLALEPPRNTTRPLHVLIGGLGMGCTLRAALDFGQVEAVDVVEVEPCIVRWNREQLAQPNGDALADPRVRVIEADFAEYIAAISARYDAVLLDIDNGPDWLVLDENVRVYGSEGLRRIAGVLRDGGVLTVWAASPSSQFEARLREIFERVEAIPVLEIDRRGQPVEYTIYRGYKHSAIGDQPIDDDRV
jgi:spermidine synthase